MLVPKITDSKDVFINVDHQYVKLHLRKKCKGLKEYYFCCQSSDNLCKTVLVAVHMLLEENFFDKL